MLENWPVEDILTISGFQFTNTISIKSIVLCINNWSMNNNQYWLKHEIIIITNKKVMQKGSYFIKIVLVKFISFKP